MRNCKWEHQRHLRHDCDAVKAAYRPRSARQAEPAPVVNNPDQRLTIMEAAQIVIRHWDLHQERGMDAAVELLRRVVARQ